MKCKSVCVPVSLQAGKLILNISVLVCQSWQGVHQARINRIIFLTLNIELFDPILAEGQELKL